MRNLDIIFNIITILRKLCDQITEFDLQVPKLLVETILCPIQKT